MKRILMGGALIAACAGTGSAWADGYDDTGSFYVTPMGNYTLVDKRRISKDGFGYQLGLGYNFPANWAAEIDFAPNSYAITGSGAHEKLSAASLDTLYKFLPPSYRLRPYAIAGAGLIKDNIGGRQADNDEWMAEAGAGVLLGLGNQSGATRVQFRTEAKYRWEFVQNTPLIPRNPGDIIFNVGLQFSFGNPTPPPPVAKTVEVEAPPPPSPPPPPPPPPLPPADSDGDGVPDSIDRCPNTPKGDKVDAYGCTIKDEIQLPGVTFATNSAELTPESDTVLGYAVKTLNNHPEFVIEVDGHTDNTGSDSLNFKLSQRRAESVMAYLRTHGVSNSLTAKGYGKSRPIADNRTPDGRLANRRVTLKVVSGL